MLIHEGGAQGVCVQLEAMPNLITSRVALFDALSRA